MTPPTAAVPTLRTYVGGQWLESRATTTAEVRNPATNDVIARVPRGGAEDVDRAVRAAQAAFPAWRATPPVNRVRPLFRFRELLETHF
ncbi:MAG: aldehyde dehydrogenase family protein, partial [bacterium]